MAQENVFLSRLKQADAEPQAGVGSPSDVVHVAPPLLGGEQLQFENGRLAILPSGREDLKEAIELASENGFTLAVTTDPSTGEITDLSVAMVAAVRWVKDTTRGQLVFFDGLSGPLVLLRTHPDFIKLSGQFRDAEKHAQTFAVSQSPRDRSIVLVARADPPQHKGTTVISRQTPPRPKLSVVAGERRQSIFDRVASQLCAPERFRRSRELCIPFNYPESGCNARAHRMCQLLLRDERVRAGKIWMFLDQVTTITNKNAPDWAVDWIMHVACLVNVDGDELVLDPALFDEPQTIDNWKAAVDSKARIEKTAASVYTLEFPTPDGPCTIGTDPLHTRMRYELLGFTFKLTERVRTFNAAGPPFCERQT